MSKYSQKTLIGLAGLFAVFPVMVLYAQAPAPAPAKPMASPVTPAVPLAKPAAKPSASAAKPAAAVPAAIPAPVQQAVVAKPIVSPPVQNITMYVGEVKTLAIQEVTRVAVGNGKLMSSTVLDSEILLLAEAPGDTSLFLWLKDGSVLRYKVNITGVDTDSTLVQIRAILKDIPGIKIDRVGENLVLSGTTSRGNLSRVEIASKSFPRTVNLVREEDVTLKKMVYMKVQIMEFKKNALENLGVDWQNNIAGPAGALTADIINNRQFRFAPQTQDPTFTLGQGAAQALNIPSQAGRAYLGIATVITSRLNLAVQNGDAWILASPELSTRSGGEAKFLAGGQIPLPTVSATGQSSVTFKDYGIKLTLKPVTDDLNNIMAVVQTELSAIDPTITVGGIPGFTTRQSDSEINVKSGQTLVISGLVDQEMSNQINKFPFLGDVPVLGTLFKSTNFRNRRTDLVIFVTPTITDPTSTINQQRVEKGKDLRERFENFLGKKGIVD